MKTKCTTIFDYKKPRKEIKNSPKFEGAIYFDGVHYFLQDLKPSNIRDGKQFEIQGCFCTHKWYQDTFYITTDFANKLKNFKS